LRRTSSISAINSSSCSTTTSSQIRRSRSAPRCSTSAPTQLSRIVFSNQQGRAGRKNRLTVADRRELWDYFRDDVAHLEQMLGVDLSRWSPEVAATTSE
jgi:hypothetical protein